MRHRGKNSIDIWELSVAVVTNVTAFQFAPDVVMFSKSLWEELLSLTVKRKLQPQPSTYVCSLTYLLALCFWSSVPSTGEVQWISIGSVCRSCRAASELSQLPGLCSWTDDAAYFWVPLSLTDYQGPKCRWIRALHRAPKWKGCKLAFIKLC